MVRLTSVFVAGIALVLSVGLALADEDKKPTKEVTLKGTITCAKCDLKKESKCTTVIKVKEGDKDVVYYFDAKAGKDNHGQICTTPKAGSVTGTVEEKDGKKTVTVTKVKWDDK